MIIVTVLLGVVAVLAAGYSWLVLRVGEAPPTERVTGEAYRVAASYVYRLPAGDAEPAVTIVAVHGFLQSPAYFHGLYSGREDTELILVGSGDYHPVLVADTDDSPPWASQPRAPVGTIAHDAQVLRQAVANLPHGRQLWLHGHSRGGAVVIEAVRQDPELLRDAWILLEAPVLPGGALFRALPRGTLVAVPLLLPLWRRQPINDRTRAVMGRLSDDRKRRVMEAMPRNPRRALTVIRNLRDIHAWMSGHGSEVLRDVGDAIVLVTAQDRILDPKAMRRAAQAGGDQLRVTPVRGVSHFISQDRPEAVLSVIFG